MFQGKILSRCGNGTWYLCSKKSGTLCNSHGSGLHGELSNWSGEECDTLSGLNLLHGALGSWEGVPFPTKLSIVPLYDIVGIAAEENQNTIEECLGHWVAAYECSEEEMEG